ncbi:GntR family transcriptional regulator [Stakelama saccharophila]|uniref:GntR family transcriptional regulator n=1 Tax=Stakelama saccharophila TaxID=3075605 RepID=A0ABZ0B7Q3_9SPHN|nr:GntR family transcriptional regulator [Stakelama sp. W311]WNO53413.1 GntR family transcriptional regulator [Stakelama sp. W311]
MSSIVIRTLPDQLVELVRDRILAGAVPVDRAIRQDALASELGVSKIPLREALTRLEQEGLVRSQANRGFFVRPLSAAEAEEVYELRLKLEPDAAALASRRATDEERKVAVTALEALDVVTANNADGVGAANRAFHLALIRPAGQSITTQLLERLHVLSDRYVRKHLEPLGRNERANQEHAEVMQCWLDRNEKGVARSMHAHIKKTIVDLRRQLGANGD